jgi:peptidoglycan/xylan/chitin deacetylase (PgdA/CDA1 family)
MVAVPTLVSEHIKLHRQVKATVGLGQIVLESRKNSSTFLSCRVRSWQEHYAELERQNVSSEFMNSYGGHLSVPREAFLQVGGFDVKIARNHDIELAFRLRENGLTFAYCSKAITFQCDDKGFCELARDWVRTGEADVAVYRKQPRMLPHLKLGNFGKLSVRETLLRRLLLAFGVSPRILSIPFFLLRNARQQDTWYRFVINYCYWRGVRGSPSGREIWRRVVRGPVILSYHALTSSGRAGRFLLPIRRFARQMSWLHRLGYTVIPLESLLKQWNEYQFPPPRSVVITFDDGYQDAWALACPILERHRFAATFFVVTGCIGGTNRWSCNPEVENRPLVSWEDIVKLKQRGFYFGSHTRSHLALDSAFFAQLDDELTGSLKDLEREIECSNFPLAYPYGRQDARAQAAAKRAGYSCAVGVEPGVNDPATPRFLLRRTEIYGTDSLLQFAVGVWLGKLPRLERARAVARTGNLFGKSGVRVGKHGA